MSAVEASVVEAGAVVAAEIGAAVVVVRSLEPQPNSSDPMAMITIAQKQHARSVRKTLTIWLLNIGTALVRVNMWRPGAGLLLGGQSNNLKET